MDGPFQNRPLTMRNSPTRSFAASLLGVLFLIAIMPGCKKKELRFVFRENAWEATTKQPGTTFSAHSIRIALDRDEIPPLPVRADELALIHRIINSLPELLPLIAQKLGEYQKDLKDPAIFREQLLDPCIYLFPPDEKPRHSWSFTVERPAVADAYGYHLEFNEKDFKEVWAGD